jgi:hypothetical protein
MDVDLKGQVHAAYAENVSQYPRHFYVRRDLNGSWTLPLQIPGEPRALAAAADGGAYLFYDEQMLHVTTAGALEDPVWLAGCDVIKAQSDRMGRVQALCAGLPFAYRELDAQGHWTTEHFFADYSVWDGFFSRDGGAIFYSKQDYYDDNIQIMMRQPDADEFDYYDYDTGQHAIERDELSMTVSGVSGLHIATSGIGSAFYSRSQTAAADEEATLSQALVVPQGVAPPTLSFLYQIQSPTGLTASGLTVTLTTPTQTVELYSGQTAGTWQHGWADLSAWAGQTVTLTFRYRQAAGEPLSTLLLDEVYLGTEPTPVIATVTPNRVVDWGAGQAELTVTGSGFLPGAVAQIAGLELPAVVSDTQTLTVQLPSLPLGRYTLRVINPSGLPTALLPLWVGYGVNLPITIR